MLPISPHGRGVLRGAKVGNGVAVGAGVAVAAGIGVATCACAPAKKATKPTRTHTLRNAIPDRIRVLAAGCLVKIFIQTRSVCICQLEKDIVSCLSIG